MSRRLSPANAITAVRPTNAVVDLLHVFSPTLVTKQNRREPAGVSPVHPEQGGFRRKRAGFSSLSFRYEYSVPTSFSAIDNLTLIRGRHTFKTGVEIRRVHLNEGNSDLGRSASRPSTNSSNHLNSADFHRPAPHQRTPQDQRVRVRSDGSSSPNLTFNVGLRYEFYQPFSVVQGRESPSTYLNARIAPRGRHVLSERSGSRSEGERRLVTELSHGKTAIRTGFGIFTARPAQRFKRAGRKRCNPFYAAEADIQI